jgi:hypothetical protein
LSVGVKKGEIADPDQAIDFGRSDAQMSVH